MNVMKFQTACIRIRIEFIEMADLKLSQAQVRRLCGLSDISCHTALASLVESGFLARRSNGSYVRRGADDAHRFDVVRARSADVANGSRSRSGHQR
jgi:DNA-binding IclR family transcriptional regulator